MRTTSIPAQITTVEDKIAGNLNLMQIILLLAPVFIGTFIYSVLPTRLQFSPYKIPLIAFTFLGFFLLSLRIKERVVLNWIIILASYWFRPHHYLYNKNDLFLRDVILTEVPKIIKRKLARTSKTTDDSSSVSESVQKLGIQIGVKKPRLNFRFNRKGVLVVQAYE
ncbi:MAG: hypothetical protein A2857_00335 [Candidatus Levybacteria bacterium RIFCSPHIGHO2_01_FULL_36_15]|nr:MAG: hypothetical protein A2857_00335 [Candidatus Levybacteria bacterium RIFCSPHIGHO2_01_FULL_36_15]